MKSVYSAVRTGSLNRAVCASSVKGIIYLRTNGDLCHLQYKLICFYKRDEKCLLCGMDWVFKQSGLRFVCKGHHLFENKQRLVPLKYKLIGFINEMKSVYCAVWTGSLNKAVCASSVKGIIYLRTNSDLWHLQYKLIGFYKRDEKCLLCGGTGSLNKAVCASSVKGIIYLRTNSDLCHLQYKLISFLTEMKSVYSAVRTGSLNKVVCASSLEG